MLPPCPVDASDPTIDVVVPSVEAPTLADALADPQHAVIWVRSGSPAVGGLPVAVERDVTLCGETARSDLVDLRIQTGQVRLERVILRPGGAPALDVVQGTVEIVDSALEVGAVAQVALLVGPDAEVTGRDLLVHGWPLLEVPIVSAGRLHLDGGVFQDNLDGVVRVLSPGGATPHTTVDGAVFVDNGTLMLPLAGGAISQRGGVLQVRDTRFDGFARALQGGALHVVGAELVVEDVRVEAGQVLGDGGAIRAVDSVVELARVDLGGVAGRGGAVAVQGGTLVADDSVLLGVGLRGGALWAGGAARVELHGTDLTGLADDGGALAADGDNATVPWVTLQGSTLADSRATFTGGGAAVTGGARLELRASEVRRCKAAQGGGLYAEAAELWLHEVDLIENLGTSAGGGAATVGSVADLWRLSAHDNRAPDGAAWWSSQDTSLVLDGSELCGNNGGSVLAFVEPDGAVDVTFTALAHHPEVPEVVRRSGGEGLLRLQNVTVVDAPAGIRVDAGPVEVRNTLFAELPDGALIGQADGGFNLGYEARGAPGAIDGDPDFVEGAEGGACVSGLHPGSASAAREAGDPALPGDDGRPLDIGRFQGDPLVDVDGDGDGVLASGDCDDADAAIFPGAPELADDGIDQDCDGADARSWIAGGACDTTGGAGWGWLGLLATAGWTALRGRAGRPSRRGRR